MVILLGSVLLYFYIHLPGFNMNVVVQQLISGISPPALVAVPMFILAAEIITSGQSSKKLIRMIKSFVGHIPGGLLLLI